MIVLVDGGDVPTVVAEAGYSIREDGDGDLAITVAAPWRGWLGAYLLDVLVRRAAADGVRNLQAEVLLENEPMLSLLRHRDAVALSHDDGVVHLSIGTSGSTADWPPLERRPKILVEVAGRRWSGEHAAEEAGLATTMCAGPDRRLRHGCPVLEGGTCPLADGADAIVVLLDPGGRAQSTPDRGASSQQSWHAGARASSVRGGRCRSERAASNSRATGRA